MSEKFYRLTNDLFISDVPFQQHFKNVCTSEHSDVCFKVELGSQGGITNTFVIFICEYRETDSPVCSPLHAHPGRALAPELAEAGLAVQDLEAQARVGEAAGVDLGRQSVSGDQEIYPGVSDLMQAVGLV